MKENLLNDASYCLGCIKKPCRNGCPLNNDIPSFIKKIKDSQYQESFNILSETTVLPSICGRICSHSTQCQGHCIRGIKSKPVNIGKLESTIGDISLKEDYPLPLLSNKKKNYKIAVIGSGPSSLTCAAFLARHQYQVTIYEKYNTLGGLLVHGIPSFRLDKEIVFKNISKILSLGIKVKYNQELGKNLLISDLEKKYDAIYLGIGGNISNNMNIPGEHLKGVYSANKLLETNNHPDYKDKYIIINGGGNVAMDISRTIKRLGAKEVTIVYRRSKNEMPVSQEELIAAEKEGIKFIYQTNIIKVIGDSNVEGIECLKTNLVKEKNNPRLVPIDIENSNHIIKCNYLIKAIGSHPDENILNTLDLTLNNSYLQVNEYNQTSKPHIFAGGDLIGTKKTVANASRSGRDAAYNIIKYLEEKEITKTITK